MMDEGGLEDELLAELVPQADQVAAIPVGDEGWQIVFQHFRSLGVGIGGIAVEQRHRDAFGIAAGELDGDARAGVGAEQSDLAQTERIQRLPHGFGIVGNLRLRERQQVRQAIARRVERDGGEAALRECARVGVERQCPARRLVQQHDRRSAPGAPVMHLALPDSHEVT